jgi:LPS export ABC transporter protein LptC
MRGCRLVLATASKRPRLAGALGLCAAIALGGAASAVPPMRLSKMTFVSSEGAFTELTVEADSGLVDTQSNRAQLESVHALWAATDGQNSLDVVCERGEFDLATNNFVALGRVRGVLGDGRRFESPWMRYDHSKGVAYTDAPVEIVDQGRTLRGGGFRYAVRTGKLRLTAGASVVEKP